MHQQSSSLPMCVVQVLMNLWDEFVEGAHADKDLHTTGERKKMAKWAKVAMKTHQASW